MFFDGLSPLTGRARLMLPQVYAAWLVSSLLYHFPPLDKLGFDIKADLSIALTIFMMSCVLLGAIVGVLSFANQLSSVGSRELVGIVVLNSMTLAMACSTYFSFCGTEGTFDRNGEVPGVKAYVCGRLLCPLDVRQYRFFQPYVMYDEKSGAISPVFTTWMTMFFLFLCNSASDFAAKAVCSNAWREMRRRERLSRSSMDLNDRSGIGTEKSIGMSMQIPRSITAFFGDLGDMSGSRGNGASKVTAKPNFLPMFPWYSGTSADLLNTLFNLTVSVKFFLGRFDMRTLLGAMRANDGSRDGGFLQYEDLSGKDEAWFDFCADTGDGGNSTYSIARCLAAPSISLDGTVLPRGDILVHGGDLAYPHPTDEVYEERLFSIYEQAFPTYREDDSLVPFKKRGRDRNGGGRGGPVPSVLNGEPPGEGCGPDAQGARAPSAARSSSSSGPSTPDTSIESPKAYMIPGNHDWIDGLDTYMKQVLHRSSIGGWQLPQDMPYFAIKFPHNWWLFGLDLALEDDIDMVQYGYFAKLAEQSMRPEDKVIIVTHCPPWLIDWFFGVDKRAHKLLRQLINGPLRGRVKLRLAGDLHFYMRHEFHRYGDGKVSCTPYEPTPAGGSPGFGFQGGSPSGGSPVFFGRSPVLDEGEVRKKLLGLFSSGSNGSMPGFNSIADGTDVLEEDRTPAQHLVVCGGGGAFLHPTHVFAPARFRDRDSNVPGEYRCVGAFPSSDDSTTICRRNLHAFRNVNSRFDVIGGVIYYVLILSALPRCSEISDVFEASSPLEGLRAFGGAMWSTIIYIFASSRVSLVAFLLLFGIAFAFARGGGIGAIKGVPARARGKPEYKGYPLGVKIRLGGLFTQLLCAFAHAMLHLSAAVALLLLLEMGIETVIRFEGVGSAGYHSLFTWYRNFEAERFPDPAEMRRVLSTYSLGLYPNAIKWAMAAYDVPEAIAVARNAVCTEGGSISQLGRLETIGYFVGSLMYFWVLATPTVGLYVALLVTGEPSACMIRDPCAEMCLTGTSLNPRSSSLLNSGCLVCISTSRPTGCTSTMTKPSAPFRSKIASRF